MNQRKRILLPFLLSLCLALASCSTQKSEPDSYTRNTIPAYASNRTSFFMITNRILAT